MSSMKGKEPIPFSQLAKENPADFSRMVAIMPFAGGAVIGSYGLFLAAWLLNVSGYGAFAWLMTKAGTVAMVLAFVLQGAIYRINRDRSVPLMLLAVVCMLASLLVNSAFSGRPDGSAFIGMIASMLLSMTSCVLAWAGAMLAKRAADRSGA